MVGERLGSAIGLVVVVLLVAASASSQVGYQLALTYEIEDAQGTVDGPEGGALVPDVHCPDTWRITNSRSTSTPSDRHLVRIGFEADGSSVSLEEQDDGRVEQTRMACEDAEAIWTPPATGWRTQTASTSGTSPGDLLPAPFQDGPCSGEPTLALDRLAPFATEVEAQTTNLHDPESVCLEARGAAEIPEDGDVPFAGVVTATLTDGDGRTLTATTCTLVAGTCWEDGNTHVDMESEGSAEDRRWTLTCEATSMLDSHIPPVGTFSCRAWLG